MPTSISPGAGQRLSAYGQLLSSSWKPDGKGDKLRSIFSLVKPPDGNAQVEQVFVLARPLSLETILPGEEDQVFSSSDLWSAFVGEFGRLSDGDKRFETFHHLFHKYAWAAPCTYGEAGVSLYEEFKALAALVHASGGAEQPADSFLLVGGDIPGIQGFVYTITSKGAAKGLRGRSFFLQLLGDAVVRRLVENLRLCQANVIYSAGGNFTLLAPAGSETALAEWRTEFNQALLKEFEGDLYLALAWETLPPAAVGTSEFVAVRERLGASIAAAKSRRFTELVAQDDGWTTLFEPQGKGGLDHCQVCQREPQPEEALISEPTEAGEPVKKCAQCLGFERLAYAIAHTPLWLTVAKADPAAQKEDWQSTLAELTGFDYRFQKESPQASGPATVYILNPANPDESRDCGFRFVANVTPRIEEKDRRWARENHPDLELPRGEPIKDFELMALQSEGIPRVGVLRMDVDNLGAIFGQYLRGSMAQVSALSGAMDLFFSGHLNRVCVEVNALGEHENVLYIIYAGGDDLFVVGSWDRMPLLAERVRGDFATHTGGNPYLTLSGGVALEGRKFPLYRAAERAGEAEGKAKGYERADGRGKDAFCFLGQVVAWGEEWNLLREQKDNLLWLVGEDQENKARREGEREKRLDRALLQVVRSVHYLYYTGLREARKLAQREKRPLPDPKMFLGRWTWMHAYSLARIARRSRDEEIKRRIQELQKIILQPETVYLSGLAARWAEYLLRTTDD
ncbi:MAG: type III-A CRISPR-associated protein Cas10/Csm1 [Anaerolineae bacterium]|nr:type III-A CRISPR-associated protein Cas10/Csm1 [Anaerolineae bacterium]